MTLSGQVAVITGASSGIGQATARELHSMGIRLVLTARRQERLEALAAELPGAVCVPGDITAPELPSRLIKTALSHFGRCDIVINNAGIAHAATIEEIDIEKVCEMARINVEAAFRMAYVAMKHFRTVGSGHLMNLSSVMGTKTRPTAGAYAGTKHAIEALSESLRMEVAKTDIKVSCIEPGLVFTGLHDQWDVHPKESMSIPHPLTAEDIARTIRYILELPENIRIPRLLILPKEHQI